MLQNLQKGLSTLDGSVNHVQACWVKDTADRSEWVDAGIVEEFTDVALVRTVSLLEGEPHFPQRESMR